MFSAGSSPTYHLAPFVLNVMTTSSSSLFTHSTLTVAFFTFKTLFNRSLPGWLLIFLLLTHLRLNSCSSDSKTNLPKYTTPHLTPPTLLEILASSLTNIFPSLTDRSFLESTPFISSLTSFSYQFLYFRLTYSFTYHFLLFWFIRNSLSFSLPA